MGKLKPQSNRPLYNNTLIATLVVDGWGVTFSTARRGLGGLRLSYVAYTVVLFRRYFYISK